MALLWKKVRGTIHSIILASRKTLQLNPISINRRASKRDGKDFDDMDEGAVVFAHIPKLPRGCLLKGKPLFFDGPPRLRNDAECAGCILLYCLSILSGRPT